MNDTAVPSVPLELYESSSPTRYAGFWRRLLASSIDALVLMPFAGLYWWASSSRAAALALLPVNALFPLYSIFMHARWGQTLGKMAAGIRVHTLAGDRISWRLALLRDSVGIVFTSVSTAALLLAILKAPASTWDQRWVQPALDLAATQPAWGHWAQHAGTAWFWSELLSLLFNAKRRALHDFIAGTVVVRVARELWARTIAP